jgi:uncharacterized peroxidase-related enzyme
VLLKNGFTPEQVEAIVRDYRQAGLEPAEVAMMDFAWKITQDATAITQADVDTLKAHGFCDEEILDITLASAARNFYGRVLDALGAEPDPAFYELDERLAAVFAAWEDHE